MARPLAAALVACLLLLVEATAEAGERLDAIKQRGVLTCGVGANVPGFSQRDASGAWRGFDVDICKAVAAAVFGDAAKIAFKPVDTVENFLKDRDIDLVLRGLTWTFGREVSGGLRFGPTVLYDGQGFLVPKKLGIANPEALSGKTICVSTDAAFLTGLRNYFRQRNLTLKAVVKAKRAEAEDALFAGECEAMTADASELAEALIGKAPHPDDFLILPQQISKEPLSALLRKGDDQFFDIVRWAIFALINAEELGVTSANVARMRGSEDPDIKFFFAAPPKGALGLHAQWTYAILRGVGNYGEIYERNLGEKSRAKLPRGLSRLWSQGGVLYAPPIR
ncbi:MAG TPA: amino acid ABC transporter substrate-binding protein [Micropepsaceae bacterium]|nr:amino acid ABC transporter substrate-binding protein [Micropepsaceae bacterium]